MSRSLPRAFRSLRTRIIAAFTTLMLVLVAGLLTVVTIRTSDEGEKQVSFTAVSWRAGMPAR
ncbi:MAG: hypothetical protein M3P91_07540 [Actinomycetota bacterium]|nr:hypothetical protein [Actinomycetota bacterium]